MGDLYLQPEKYIESDNTEILQLAGKLKNPGTVIGTAENIFNWVAANIKYSGYLKNERGAFYALTSRQGDCTEFAYLFVALCRANNIPARGLGGYVSGKNKIIKPQSYHNWAEFYDNGAWKIVDPLEKVFAQNRTDYIALQIIGNSPGNPYPQFNRYRVNKNELNVTVNEIVMSIN